MGATVCAEQAGTAKDNAASRAAEKNVELVMRKHIAQRRATVLARLAAPVGFGNRHISGPAQNLPRRDFVEWAEELSYAKREVKGESIARLHERFHEKDLAGWLVGMFCGFLFADRSCFGGRTCGGAGRGKGICCVADGSGAFCERHSF